MRRTVTFLAVWHDNSGTTAIEYAFVAILISTVAIAAMDAIGSWTAGAFAIAANSL